MVKICDCKVWTTVFGICVFFCNKYPREKNCILCINKFKLCLIHANHNVHLLQIVPPGLRQPVSESLGAVPGQLQHRAPAPSNQEKGPAKTQALQRQLTQQHALTNSVSHLLNSTPTQLRLFESRC